MKLTKGMKKALSLLLSAAMVVTGVNVTTNTASAEGEDAPKSHVVEVTIGADAAAEVTAKLDGEASDLVKIGWDKDATKGETPTEARVTLAYSLRQEVAAYANPAAEVVDLSEGKEIKTYSTSKSWGSDIQDKTWKKGDKISLAEAAAADEWKIDESDESNGDAWKGKNSFELAVPFGTTLQIKLYDAPQVKDLPLAEEDGYKAFLMFADGSWAWQNMDVNEANGGKGVGKDATITGDGTYTVSIDKDGFPDADPAEGATVFCVDMVGMGQAQNFDASNVKVKDVVIKCDGRKIASDGSKMYVGRIEYGKNNNLRLEIRNEYGWDKGDFKTKDEFDSDSFGFAESLSVTFTLEGIQAGTTPENAFLKEGEDGKMSPNIAVAEGVTEADPLPTATPEVSANPSVPNKPVATPKAPAKTTTATAITTKSAISTKSAFGTSKIAPKQKTVVVAPGKSVKVAFTATAAKNTSGAAVVTATTASKKVATAKVKGKKVVIKAPKKAVKGASTTVTLKSTNGDKKVSAKIKVYVRNSAKKVKAAKKAITVKKGKTTKLVIKASKVQNKKKAFADTITVKGKIVKLTSVKFAKGKATLTLKGVKKAKKKAVTIKVGKKSVKIKATVK